MSGRLLSLLQSFPKDRKQRNVLNGQCSSCGNVLAGVPLGSVLGPLISLIYINDLTADLESNVKSFADDASFFPVVHDPNAASEKINHDLALVGQ